MTQHSEGLRPSKEAFMEGDGRISIIRWDNGETAKLEKKLPL
jgi:hypothetical protein